MATTIISSFQKLKENLEITGLQKSTTSTRQESVRNAFVGKMDILDSFLTGSYARSTMIAPLSEADIDIFIVLDPKYWEIIGQASLLDKVKSVLLKTYTKTPKISRNGQAVTITFTDFAVDVVPAFDRQTFYRQSDGYLIPNSIQNIWIETNPKIHVDLMTNHNIMHSGNLVPIIKMIKGWNKNINYSFTSFYLELLAVKIFDDATIYDFPREIRFFFDKGRELIKSEIKDLVQYGGQINPLRNCQNVEDAVKKFETAYNIAIKAEQYEKNHNTRAAVEEWQKIFGNYFPAYG
jgi:hypothetical protein